MMPWLLIRQSSQTLVGINIIMAITIDPVEINVDDSCIIMNISDDNVMVSA